MGFRGKLENYFLNIGDDYQAPVSFEYLLEARPIIAEFPDPLPG